VTTGKADTNVDILMTFEISATMRDPLGRKALTVTVQGFRKNVDLRRLIRSEGVLESHLVAAESTKCQ
jgi:hypothetical protein